MQIYVPTVNAIFVPILKSASRSLLNAIVQTHPDHVVVNKFTLGERILMWRNPKERIESTYRFMRDQNAHLPEFSKWVVEVCREGLREPHLKRQVDFCDNPGQIFFWDFEGFRKFFGIKRRAVMNANKSGTHPTEWDDRAINAFVESYASDLLIWQRGNRDAAAFWSKAARLEHQEEEPDTEFCLESSKIDSP